MTTIKQLTRLIQLSALVLAAAFAPQAYSAYDAASCEAPASWFSGTPALPAEVTKSADGGKDSNFCDFYQFSWQSFLNLMSPVSGSDSSNNNADVRIFSDTSKYPFLETNAKDNTPADSCDGKVTGTRLSTSLEKTFSTGQAGDGATIYDQVGNVVYYDVRFSKNMCEITQLASQTNFAESGTDKINQVVEIKTAWKVISTSDDASEYLIWKNPADLPDTTLGLVGLHLAIATPDHPEMVWATFEHNSNAPDCTNPSADTGWSFASKSCVQNIGTKQACTFNEAQPSNSSTGSATEICRVFPYGTGSGDLKAAENLSDIQAMNKSVSEQLTGDMAVFKNYFNVGAIWVNDITQGSQDGSDIGNQRGSLRLANTVAETTFQDVTINSFDTKAHFSSNCLGCHSYAGTASAKNKNTTSGRLSHIFDDIAAGAGMCIDVQAGPIFSNEDAKAKCPGVCANPASDLTWKGQWTTTEPGVMSVCGCCGS